MVLVAVVVEQTHVFDVLKWNWREITGNLQVGRDTDVNQKFKQCWFHLVSFVSPLLSSDSSGPCRDV